LGGQLRLKLEHRAIFSRDRFLVSTPNRDAAVMLDAWPGNEQGSALALIGPSGTGKSHLAAAWAARTGAQILRIDALKGSDIGATGGSMLLDEADAAPHGEAFFHILNAAARPGGALLMVGRTAPRTWPVDVADLRSRLNALPVIEIGEPDDAILRGVLLKLFQERNIRPPQDLLDYLLRRIERSVSAAQAVVASLDEAASVEHRPLSRVLAREILQDGTYDDD
jgi:chromosomal replication initiation ATPase DnaA